MELVTNSSGAFNSGGLIPGDYKTRITARGFKPVEMASTVLVGNIATMNADLEIGNGNEVVEVKGSALRVNTEQPAVQGVLNEQQIENLPVNGRNFLDLAQLEPGVQIQDAANFGKDGYSSISFGGRFGRTARIEVDGLDYCQHPRQRHPGVPTEPVEPRSLHRADYIGRGECEHAFGDQRPSWRSFRFFP